MNVYDFDNTIYDGESLVDFYFFCLKRHPKLLRYLFYVFRNYVSYRMCRIGYDELHSKLSQHAVTVLSEFDNLDDEVKQFWKKNSRKLKKFYFQLQRWDDVVLSASFNFLIEDICREIGIKHVICSEVDTKTGQIKKLCYRDNKMNCFREQFGGAVIDKFYTDSANDVSVIRQALSAYVVKKNDVIKIK